MIHKIAKEIAQTAKRIVIVGGHYCVSEEFSELSADSETEKHTFSTAVRMVKTINNEGSEAKILLWVNDIGISLDKRKELKTNYKIPDSYSLILRDEKINPEIIEIYFESTIRNKASVKLRQMAKLNPSLFNKYSSEEGGLIRCIDLCTISRGENNIYSITGPKGIKLVVKEGPNPKCNLILATLFYLINSRMSPDAIISIFNVLYANRISLGLYVLSKLYGNNTPICSMLMNENILLSSDSYFYEENT